ncbi:hypothetical protein EDEG_04180 [Edhazardia aedis USNM 41457]|uniref:Uncharacterized protein n=1 Tax=Edhazardia aedis (strain USNM 41457) TaxID=1003232 RepID=J9DU92_EDHAE|nr:hypothetical protein EDEG_04180 [Edhazardia aedis USNM 41457]|eukprot:EJW04867.1 hypothetical protein EDEG_04180 [Edhazardia aedis USNM 41457]
MLNIVLFIIFTNLYSKLNIYFIRIFNKGFVWYIIPQIPSQNKKPLQYILKIKITPMAKIMARLRTSCLCERPLGTATAGQASKKANYVHHCLLLEGYFKTERIPMLHYNKLTTNILFFDWKID